MLNRQKRILKISRKVIRSWEKNYQENMKKMKIRVTEHTIFSLNTEIQSVMMLVTLSLHANEYRASELL